MLVRLDGLFVSILQAMGDHCCGGGGRKDPGLDESLMVLRSFTCTSKNISCEHDKPVGKNSTFVRLHRLVSAHWQGLYLAMLKVAFN